MKNKYKDRIKLFICITFILSLAFVCIRVTQVECDRIAPLRALVTGMISCAYAGIAVFTYQRLDKDDDVY